MTIMGYLLIDHSAGQGIDGRQGIKQEFETVNCAHCQSLIALLARPRETLVISNMDIGKFSLVADKISTRYTGKHQCRRCKKDICRACARGGNCTPFVAKIENAIKKQRWEEHFQYAYSQCSNR
jgi:hypothetical protein